MGLTAQDVLDRTRSEYLSSGGTKTEKWDVTDAAVDASQLTMSLAGRITVPADSVLEFDDGSMELVLNKSTDSNNDLTLQTRGYLESTAATHASGAKVVLDRVWPSQVLFNALQAVIGTLRGYGLYAVGYTSALTVNTLTPVALPAGATGVLSMYYQNGSNWFPLAEGSGYRMFPNFTSATDTSVQFFSGFQGAALRVAYKTDYTLPDSLADDLDDCDIPATLQPHLAMGVAAYVLQGRDVPLLDNDKVRSALANAGIQPGTRSGVARNLLNTFVGVHVLAERNRLVSANPVSIVYGG